MTARFTARHGAGFCVLALLLPGALPARLSAQQPGPIRVFGREELSRTGRTGLAEILQALDPGFNAPRPSNAAGTDHAPPLFLHGFGADQLLVLINGTPRHPSALMHVESTLGRGQGMVDLDAVPLSAVERIELYAPGGGARFGFGAVAGVLNIVLRARAEGELHAVLGTTTEGDGSVVAAGASHAFPLGRNGFVRLSAEASSRGATNRALPDQRPQYFPGDPRNDDAAAARQVTSRLGDPASRELAAFVHAVKPLRGNLELYGFGGLHGRRGKSGELWRRPSDDRTVRALFPDGFLPLLTPKIQDGSILAGARGSLLRWSWDASLSYGRSAFQFELEHTANVSMGQQSRTGFDAGTLRADLFGAALELRRRITTAWMPPLLLSLGASHRSEGYQIQPGEPDSYRHGAVPILNGPNTGKLAPPGAQGFPGFQPADAVTARRGSVAGFATLSTVVLRRLALDAAGRLESHPDAGWYGLYELSARFGPLRGVTLGGMHGTGARVPALGQAWYSRTVTELADDVALDDRIAPVGSPLAVLLGAKPLRLERSRHTALAATLTPLRGLDLSAEYFRVSVEDRIILSGRFDDPAVQAFLAQRQFPGIAGVRFFRNALATRTSGLDASAAYRLEVGAAELRFRTAVSFHRTTVPRVDSVPGLLAPFKSVLFDRVEQARIEQGQPRDNLLLSAELRRGAWTAEARSRRAGAVASFGPAPDGSLDQRFAAQWVSDASVGYRPRPELALRLGADNLFNSTPERNRHGNASLEGNSHFGIFPYNNVSPFGFNGRLLYLRATWTY